MTNSPNQSIEAMQRAIVEVHNESKALFLLCEEIEPRQFRTFIQPYNELRHAYEHTVRCMANQLGMDGRSPDNEYQRTSVSKALGHEYRGFFDCADWLAIILREAIQNTLQPYSTACIQASLPDYYSHDRIRVLEISEAIAKLRGDKDVARRARTDEAVAINEPSAAVDEVRKYKAVLSELQGIHKKVLRALPGLEEYKQKTLREDARKAKCDDRRQLKVKIIAGLVLAGILSAAGYVWKSVTTKPALTEPVDIPDSSHAKPRSSDTSRVISPKPPASAEKHS